MNREKKESSKNLLVRLTCIPIYVSVSLFKQDRVRHIYSNNKIRINYHLYPPYSKRADSNPSSEYFVRVENESMFSV